MSVTPGFSHTGLFGGGSGFMDITTGTSLWYGPCVNAVWPYVASTCTNVPAGLTTHAGGWTTPAALSLPGNWLGDASNANTVAVFHYRFVITLTATQAACAYINARFMADDSGSFRVLNSAYPAGYYFSGGSTAAAGQGNYISLTAISNANVFAAGLNVLEMTNWNTASGAGGIYVNGFLTTICDVPPSPPPPSPPPPLISPPPPPVVVNAFTDPHLHFAHGGRADFRGEHSTWYNMLSAKNASVNVLFQNDDFRNLHKLVHGSKMSRLGMTLRTGLTGQMISVGFNASAGASQALIRTSAGDQWLTHKSGAFTRENVQIVMREKKLGGIGKAPWHGMALLITDGRWEVQAWSKPYPNAAANPGKELLNVGIQAHYDADRDVVAPHGLIGQSYDGDGVAVDGAVDDYKGNEITTKAMAEGAIEGSARDYKMASAYATSFKFSRFDAVAAKPRDVTKLKGTKRSRKPLVEDVDQPGASEDLTLSA